MYFKYLNNESIDTLVSNDLMNKIHFVGHSRIDNYIIFSYEEINDKKVEDILLYSQIDITKLKNLLRKIKINNIFDKKYRSEYEFLNFWYKNVNKLVIVKQYEQYFHQ